MNRSSLLRVLTVFAVTVLVSQLVLAARAEVTALEIKQREPYAEGAPQGEHGTYERLAGVARFALDPALPANRSIVDLSLAPRNKESKVEFWADFEILLPADLAKANGALFYEVNNRGGMSFPKSINGGADGFLMRQGFIVVGSGWIGEVLPDAGQPLRMLAPVAQENGKPIRGIVRQEVSSESAVPKMCLAYRGRMGSYRPSERGMKEATVTMREREADERQPIPREDWKLIVTEVQYEGKAWPLPVVELEVKGGLKPGWLYEVIYEAEGPIVQGVGLAGIRDLVSFLKFDVTERNPLRGGGEKPVVNRVLGFGVSQSGRCLRDLLYEGFNADEQGRQVFDGVIPLVAGGGLGSFNHRFASPTRTNGQHDEHLFPVDYFPFTYGDSSDPFTGKVDGILRKCRETGTTPKVFHAQTSNEYWGRSGSLVHTDPMGKKDALIPPEVRLYTFGGAAHGSGSGVPGPRGNGTLAFVPTDYRPLLRALVMAMDVWVRDGQEPPPSIYPRIAEGTLVDWRKTSSGWPAIPGVVYPEVLQIPRFLNRAPEWQSKGIAKNQYTVLVPGFDADGNERGSLLVPGVRVPLASSTGWNLREASIGAGGEFFSLKGGYIPFARTREERETAGDPRPAILERYKDFADYQRRYEAAARELIDQRYLLEEDLPRLKVLCEKFRPVFDAGNDEPGKEEH